MGRKPSAAASTASTGDKPVVRRRRRTVDHGAQTALLLTALMKGAGRPVTTDEALRLITWARGVHAEKAELAKLKPRTRAVKPDQLIARRAAYEVNQALLDGVLAGNLNVGLDDSGAIVFHGA